MSADNARRTVDLHLRLTPEEAAEIDERAESFSMTRSEYMRFAAQAVLPREDRDPLSRSIAYIDAETWRRILFEFRRHGVNLNQAAMACNTLARAVGPYLGSGRPDAAEMHEFSRTLKEVRSDLAILLDENLELEARVKRALSLDSLIKIDRGWHHAAAQG